MQGGHEAAGGRCLPQSGQGTQLELRHSDGDNQVCGQQVELPFNREQDAMYTRPHIRRILQGRAPVTNHKQLLAALRRGRLSPRPSDLTDQELNTRKRMHEDAKFQNLAGVID